MCKVTLGQQNYKTKLSSSHNLSEPVCESMQIQYITIHVYINHVSF